MEEKSHPNPERLWKHRRRFAYMSFASATITILLFIILGVYSPLSDAYLEFLGSITVPYILGCFSIIGAYVSWATWADHKNRPGG